MVLRWGGRLVVAIAVLFVVVYLGDWAVFKLRGSPHAKVTVNNFLAVPLKGNRQEIDYLGTGDLPCSVSLFSQGGLSACWRLRRQANQMTSID